MKLSDKIISKLLTWIDRSTDIIVPNYYIGRWEYDVFRLTDSGIVYEYEIKISKSDFKNEFKKSFENIKRENGQLVLLDETNHSEKGLKKRYVTESISKHDEILKGKRCNRFFFVVPENLIQTSEIPDHCGLIYFSDRSFRVVKNAKMIHKQRVNPDIYQQIAKKLSFREKNLRRKLNGIY